MIHPSFPLPGAVKRARSQWSGQWRRNLSISLTVKGFKGDNIIIIIPTPLCPKACRTLNFLTVQENRALAGRVKSPYRRSRKNISD
jgi:hypothetical protein